MAAITGANTGVGKETALGLARAGFHVVLGCRSFEKGAAAAEWVCRQCAGASVEVLPLDLLDLKSAVRFAAALGALCRQSDLRVLVCNAGVGGTNRKSAALPDGSDSMYRVNFVGHFVLVQQLLPLLQRSGSRASPARVVTLSSVMHRFGSTAEHWLAPLTQHAGFSTYATSKLTMACLAAELTRRYRDAGVVGIAVNPGAVNSDIWYRAEAWGAQPTWLQTAQSLLFASTFLTTAQGACTSISAATEARWRGGEAPDGSPLYLCPYRTPFAWPMPFELHGPFAGARCCRPRAEVLDRKLCGELWDGMMRAKVLAPFLKRLEPE